MSALGHKRTFRGATAMSALPSKADIDPRQGKLAGRLEPEAPCPTHFCETE